MSHQESSPASFFNEESAAKYDTKFARLAPFRDALHLLIGAKFAELPAEARILCVGAGTGSEILYLAEEFPLWRFTAVEPSAPMLAVCRRRIEERGITSRCDFHEGYLDSLPASEPFHAATSLLVSQFVLKREARVAFFRGIADRLQPGGLLASADLASDINSAEYESLLEVWLRLMKTTDVTDEQLAKIRVAYGRDVALLPLDEVKTIIASGGFEPPVQFLQTCLIHAWWAKRNQPVD